VNKSIIKAIFVCMALLCAFCGRKEAKVDIITERMLATQDTIPLEITHISPIGKTEGYQETFKILIGFNQPMVPLQEIRRAVSSGPLMIKPTIDGTYQWLGTRTLAFIPSDTIQPGTVFEVKLFKKRIRSLTGMILHADTTWTFESVRPRLVSSLPYQGAQFIDLKSRIYLRFNIEMSPERIGDKIKIYYTEGMPSKVWCGTVRSKSPRFRGEIRFSARHLRDEEKSDYPLKDWENNKTLVLTPKNRLPVESQIEVFLYPGLLARQGNLGFDQEEALRFNTYNNFALLSHSSQIPGEQALRLCFSNDVVMKELMGKISIEPGVEIPLEYMEDEWSTSDVHLYLPFEPNKKYDVRISKSLRDIYGSPLDQDYRFVLEVGDYTPHVDMPTGISIVESKSDLRFPVNAVNVDSVYLQLARLNIDEAVPFLNTRDLFYSQRKYNPSSAQFFGVHRYFHINTFSTLRNQQTLVPIELKDILGTEQTGLVFIQLDHLGQTRHSRDYRYLKAFLDVGDIGVTWKYSPENNLIWTTSLNDAKPIKNAKVQIRNKNNRIFWEGRTDAAGFCESPGWAELGGVRTKTTYEYEDEYEMYEYEAYDEPDLWLTIRTDNDQAILSNQWSFGIDPWRFNIAYNWYVTPEEYEAYIFTEKGLYRSGETVRVKGLLREKKKGQWELPDVRYVYFTVRNSRGEVILVDTLRINTYGAFHQNIPLDSDAPTGVYSINATLLGKARTFYETFRVEAYRPAEFEVKVSAQKDTFIAEETFKGLIEGRYLFGMPMKDAGVTWSLRRSYHYLSFHRHAGYRFGEYIEGSEGELLSSGRGKLNQNGEYPVSVRLSKDDIYAPSLIHFEGIVTAPNMTTVAKEQNWLVLNANYLIGLKTSKYLYVLGDTVDLNAITVNPAGNVIDNKQMKIEVFKTEWKSIKKARLGGRYEWISERVETKVSEQNLKSRQGSTIVRIAPESPGYYYVRAHGMDNRRRKTATRTYFYVAGHGYAGWEMRDDDIIELVADKDNYDVGDTARILVKSPYDSAQCLVTLERELVMGKFTKQLQGNADYLEVPIKSIYLPNIYVCVTLLRGRVKGLTWDDNAKQDMGKPQFKIGYLNLNINADEKRLRVKASPDRLEYRPRDSVTISLEVSDHKNRGVANSEVTLFVVDLGVLNLIDFRTPDPFRHFYGSRPLSVRTIESRVNILGERSYGEKGEERGGGGAFSEGVSYREKFIATAFYRADIVTNKQGRGKVIFELPDNLTKFKIMAVAQTKMSQFGKAESTLAVNLPFLMTPSTPRFARVGDEFNAGVVLHNRTDRKERAYVQCSVTGMERFDEANKEVVLPANSSKEVMYRFNAEKQGEVALEFKSRMGKETDALRLRISVVQPPLFEAVATFSSTEDSSVEALVVPSEIHESMGGFDVALSSTVLAGMERGVEFLWDYPYLCLEQQMSKILPLIVGEELINQFGLAQVTGKALRDTVQSILNNASEYQKSAGGYVYFKESDYPCAYLSAYTMYVQYRAKKAGYNIDKETIKSGIGYLQRVLRWQDVNWTYPYDDYARLTTKAFCLYSLALWGEYEHAYTARLFERRDQLSIFGKTLLLKAGRLIGLGNTFESTLRADLMNKIKVSPTSAHFEENVGGGWTFPSPAKVTAFVAQTLIELDIHFPFADQTARWLVQERSKKTKPTTHENAFVFDAFVTYYNRYEGKEPDFVATVLLGGEELLRKPFKGRTNAKPEKLHIAFDQIARDTLLPVTIKKQGTGRVYYTLRMSYALMEKPYPFDRGFYVWKDIFTLDGKPAKKFKRGEVYKVVVHVVTPETRFFAVVDDPLPAGFVPIQTSFATESREIREHHRTARGEERGHWWGSFDHEEYYDDRILLFAQQLFPGEHTKVYFVRAASPGRFLNPITKAEEMYAPEVFGSSIQRYITID